MYIDTTVTFVMKCVRIVQNASTNTYYHLAPLIDLQAVSYEITTVVVLNLILIKYFFQTLLFLKNPSEL